jgi:hypothetical protein
MRDDEVIAAANEHGMAMVFTGMRHFRHWAFCLHTKKPALCGLFSV